MKILDLVGITQVTQMTNFYSFCFYMVFISKQKKVKNSPVDLIQIEELF